MTRVLRAFLASLLFLSAGFNPAWASLRPTLKPIKLQTTLALPRFQGFALRLRAGMSSWRSPMSANRAPAAEALTREGRLFDQQVPRLALAGAVLAGAWALGHFGVVPDMGHGASLAAVFAIPVFFNEGGHDSTAGRRIRDILRKDYGPGVLIPIEGKISGDIQKTTAMDSYAYKRGLVWLRINNHLALLSNGNALFVDFESKETELPSELRDINVQVRRAISNLNSGEFQRQAHALDELKECRRRYARLKYSGVEGLESRLAQVRALEINGAFELLRRQANEGTDKDALAYLTEAYADASSQAWPKAGSMVQAWLRTLAASTELAPLKNFTANLDSKLDYPDVLDYDPEVAERVEGWRSKFSGSGISDKLEGILRQAETGLRFLEGKSFPEHTQAFAHLERAVIQGREWVSHNNYFSGWDDVQTLYHRCLLILMRDLAKASRADPELLEELEDRHADVGSDWGKVVFSPRLADFLNKILNAPDQHWEYSLNWSFSLTPDEGREAVNAIHVLKRLLPSTDESTARYPQIMEKHIPSGAITEQDLLWTPPSREKAGLPELGEEAPAPPSGDWGITLSLIGEEIQRSPGISGGLKRQFQRLDSDDAKMWAVAYRILNPVLRELESRGWSAKKSLGKNKRRELLRAVLSAIAAAKEAALRDAEKVQDALDRGGVWAKTRSPMTFRQALELAEDLLFVRHYYLGRKTALDVDKHRKELRSRLGIRD
ncbi:MAG: hypothetical protein HY921_06400 [Elusimicrobia bacterium]|nr:hypothetical protein [Elusimicrobiota bacterium]